MTDIKITLDNNANWDSSALGTFDASSSLADEVDADDDGVVTQTEIEQYQKAHPKATEPKKDYAVIKDNQTPQNWQELMQLVEQASQTYDGMEKDANQIFEDSDNFLSQCNALIDSSSTDGKLQQTNPSALSIDELSDDFDVTSNTVDNAIEKAEKNGVMKTWLFGAILKTLSDKLAKKEDSVKQLIEKTKTKIEDAQKTVESKDNPDDSNGKKDKTAKV